MTARRPAAAPRQPERAARPCPSDQASPGPDAERRLGDRAARPAARVRLRRSSSAAAAGGQSRTARTAPDEVGECFRAAWRPDGAAAAREPPAREPPARPAEPPKPAAALRAAAALDATLLPLPGVTAESGSLQPAVVSAFWGEPAAASPSPRGLKAEVWRPEELASKALSEPDRRSDPGRHSADSSLRKRRPSAR